MTSKLTSLVVCLKIKLFLNKIETLLSYQNISIFGGEERGQLNYLEAVYHTIMDK